MTIEKSCRDLLLAVVQDSTDPGYIQTLASGIADWDRLIDLAMQHRVVPNVVLRLAEMGTAVPNHALDRLHREYDRIVLHNLSNAAELIAVLQEFSREGIRAIPFKGVVLATSVYGDLLKRPSGDLDLLIDRRDLARASQLILERGYELRSPVAKEDTSEEPGPYEHTFVRSSNGMVLELRWRLDLVSNRFRRNLGMDWVWPHCRTMVLSGAQVPDLEPEFLLLILCMHGSKHSWSRLMWICDIAKLLASAPSMKWELVLAEAGRQGLRRSLALGILLANHITGVAVPHEVLHRFEADKAACRLAEHFSRNLLENPGQNPPGRVPYGIHLLNFSDRMQLIFSLSFLRPSDRDREIFDLPERLRSLYLLLRPLRLLSDRSAR